MIDTDHTGAMGYSFDGYNAFLLGGARVNPTFKRIKAVMPMAPEGAWLFGEDGLAAVDRPALIIAATNHDINH